MRMKHWILVGLVVVLVLPLVGMALKSANRQALAPAETVIVDPWKQEAAAAAPAVVARERGGACPAGYQDHPSDPTHCVLPMVIMILDRNAQRAEARRMERRAKLQAD